MEKLSCPVCDRPDVNTDTCPNCETDLSLIRSLTQLPTISDKSFWATSRLLLWLIFIALLVSGIVPRGIFNTWIAKGDDIIQEKTVQDLESENKILEKEIKVLKEAIASKSNEACVSSFYYTVRPGDFLNKIAHNFYGESQQLSLIVEANPSLVGKEDNLQIGQKIIIPSMEEACK
jgi:LysM repeat protein